MQFSSIYEVLTLDTFPPARMVGRPLPSPDLRQNDWEAACTMTPPALQHVLLIEDSEDDAFFFHRAFERTGLALRLERLSSGADAIDYFLSLLSGPRQDEPCPIMVFLDLKLPIFSGFDIIEWLASRGLLEKLRISVLSGSESVADLERARELGVENYFVKPIAPDLLRATLLPLLGKAVAAASRPCLTA